MSSSDSVLASEDAITYRLNYCDATAAEREPNAALYRFASERISAAAAVQQFCSEYGVRIDESVGTRITCWDDYLIPGSLTLRNRLVDSKNPFGIEDPARFRELECGLSHIRMVELLLRPVQGTFDYEHSKTIHRRIFQDVYSWAGEERIGPDTSVVRFLPDAAYEPGDPSAPLVAYRYLSGPEMTERAQLFSGVIVSLIERPKFDVQEFFSLSTELMSEWLTIHPYRDGNLRAGWVYMNQVMSNKGIVIDPKTAVSGSETRDRLNHGILKNQADADPSFFAAAVQGMTEHPAPVE